MTDHFLENQRDSMGVKVLALHVVNPALITNTYILPPLPGWGAILKNERMEQYRVQPGVAQNPQNSHLRERLTCLLF